MFRPKSLDLKRAAFIAVLILLALSVFLNLHLLYRLREKPAELSGTYRKISAEAHETTARYLVFNRDGDDFVIYEGNTVLDLGHCPPGGVEGFYSLEGENGLYAQLYAGDGEIYISTTQGDLEIYGQVGTPMVLSSEIEAEIGWELPG